MEEGLKLANQIKKPDSICIILYELGNVYLLEGKTDSAVETFKKMLEIAPAGDQELLAFANFGLARVCLLQGDREKARLYANKSVTMFEMMGHRQVAEVKEWMKSALLS